MPRLRLLLVLLASLALFACESDPAGSGDDPANPGSADGDSTGDDTTGGDGDGDTTGGDGDGDSDTTGGDGDGDTTGGDGDGDTTGGDGDGDTTGGDGDGDGDGDGAPPLFDGVETIEMGAPGEVTMTWAPADGDGPFQYEVFAATSAGGHDFSTPSFTSASTSIAIDGLTVEKGLRHYFVVRARDANGLTDENLVEASALFVANDEIEFLADLPVAGRSNIADVAVNEDLTLAAIAGYQTGDAYIFDITDPRAPRQIATIPGVGTQNDVEFLGDVLYVSHEFRDDAVGIEIYDVVDAASPVSIGTLKGGVDGVSIGARMCHNITIHENAGLIYCSASFGDRGVHIFSTGFAGLGGSPEAPAYVGSVSDPNGWVHDVYGRDDRLYVAYLDGGFTMYDITNPSAPTVLGSYEYANQFCHNAWPSKDGTYAYISDEKPQSQTDGMRVFDIRDPRNIRQVAKFERGSDRDVIHNVEVEGDFGYISYYGLGVYIVDLRDPANPIEVDSYDPVPSSRRTGMTGTWGVQATKGPLVFASDRDRGLVILSWDRPDTRITGRD